MRSQRALWVVGVGLLLAATPVLAHHSMRAQYDENQPVMLDGTITKVIWQNPHVHVFIDVKGEDGKTANWELELGSPNVLMIQGWKLDSLKQGDQITVTGYRARDGSNLAIARKVTLDAH